MLFRDYIEDTLGFCTFDKVDVSVQSFHNPVVSENRTAKVVALANQGLLAEPTQITVKTVAGEKFERIVKWQLKDRPVMQKPGDDSDEIGEYHSNSPGDLGVSQEPEWDDEVPF